MYIVICYSSLCLAWHSAKCIMTSRCISINLQTWSWIDLASTSRYCVLSLDSTWLCPLQGWWNCMDGRLLPLLTEFHYPVPVSLFLGALLSSKQFLDFNRSISHRQKGEIYDSFQAPETEVDGHLVLVQLHIVMSNCLEALICPHQLCFEHGTMIFYPITSTCM
jgi:hypothetical protein